MALQFIATKFPVLPLALCIAFAKTSFPVPLSPVIRTLAEVGATFLAIAMFSIIL